MGVKLTGPYGNAIEVPEESADYWQALGFTAEKAKPQASEKTDSKPPAKKAAAKKSSK